MRKLMQWAQPQGAWSPTEYLGLPALQADGDADLQRWQAVAGGLALVLSRLSATERAARFPNSERLFQGLQRRLRGGGRITPSSELLGEVMHELAGVADPLTSHCLRACFDASVRDGSADDAPVTQAFGETQRPSRLQSQPRPSQDRAVVPTRVDSVADASQELFLERSRALRVSVAAARSR